jgi:Flp pilus assembly secretin CpaC
VRRRSFLIPALCAAAAAGPAAAAVRLAVPVAHAARLLIPGAAGSVVVGDPAVADAIVIDPHTIYVQGKAYGQTEIVVLDRAGRQVWQGDIAVITPNEGRVTVMRGPLGSGGGTGALNSLLGSVVLTTEMTCADVCTAVVPAPAKGK